MYLSKVKDVLYTLFSLNTYISWRNKLLDLFWDSNLGVLTFWTCVLTITRNKPSNLNY